MSYILPTILVALLLATVPTWRYRRQWGYLPGTIVGLLLLLFFILMLFGAIRF